MPTDLIGTDLQLKLLKRIQNGAPDEFGRAMLEETKIEVKECKRVTPVDKGDLVESIEAVGPERDGRSMKTAIIAGAPGSGAEEYAVQQHEDFDLVHPHGGGPKFIEGPLNASAPYMTTRIGARIDMNKVAK